MIDFEAIAKLPAPGMNVPCDYGFSPDGQSVSYLWSSQGSLYRDLWIYDLKTQYSRCLMTSEGGIADDSNLSLEEQMARERDRNIGLGITSYQWEPRGRFLLVNCDRTLIALSPTDGTIQWTVQHRSTIQLPSFSPDGSKLAFVSKGDLWYLPLSPDGHPTASAQPLTRDATATRLNGIADQLTWEELGRQKGFWWLPDSDRLLVATATIDQIPPIYILNPTQDKPETHRYSFPSSPIPNTTLAIIPLDTGEKTPLTIPKAQHSYLAHVFIHPDGQAFILQLARNQQTLTLLSLNLTSGKATPLLQEQDKRWINVSDELKFIKQDGSFLWKHERRGRFQLERRASDGQLLAEFPPPAGPIHEIVDIDEDRGWVYYIAADDDPRERHLFRSSLEGNQSPEKITAEPGCHSAVLSPDKENWLHLYDSLTTPPRLSCDRISDNSSIAFVENDWTAESDPFNLQPPELISFLAPDGKTLLYGALYHPKLKPTNDRPPLIVSVYGGPHYQAVKNSWRLTADMRAQHFAQQGYRVLKVDNRGAWGRGIKFEAPLHLKLGQVEVKDQVEGVRFITQELTLADPNRVGIYGWSYGGYMAAMCLTQHPEIFSAAVAGAPVIRWQDYDSLYTERYMGIPESSPTYPEAIPNPDGYQQASVLSHLENLAGKLLLIHGLKDENVLVRHTLSLIEAANQLGEAIDLLILPNARHRVRDQATRVYLEQRLYEHLQEALRSYPY